MAEDLPDRGYHFVKGVKSKNVSLKILQYNDTKFLVQRKSYFLSICFRKEDYWCETLHEAEDKYLDLRFGLDKRI